MDRETGAEQDTVVGYTLAKLTLLLMVLMTGNTQ